MPSAPWSPSDVGPVLRLMSHSDDVPTETLVRNATTAVMFLRALQKVGYFEGVVVRDRGRVVHGTVRIGQKRALE